MGAESGGAGYGVNCETCAFQQTGWMQSFRAVSKLLSASRRFLAVQKSKVRSQNRHRETREAGCGILPDWGRPLPYGDTVTVATAVYSPTGASAVELQAVVAHLGLGGVEQLAFVEVGAFERRKDGQPIRACHSTTSATPRGSRSFFQKRKPTPRRRWSARRCNSRSARCPRPRRRSASGSTGAAPCRRERGALTGLISSGTLQA